MFLDPDLVFLTEKFKYLRSSNSLISISLYCQYKHKEVREMQNFKLGPLDEDPDDDFDDGSDDDDESDSW